MDIYVYTALNLSINHNCKFENDYKFTNNHNKHNSSK